MVIAFSSSVQKHPVTTYVSAEHNKHRLEAWISVSVRPSVYKRDQGRTIWLTCNWNAPIEECASTTNPQVGIKYERSIYVTFGRCLSGNFLQHSNTDKLSVSSKSCLHICENHCSTCWGNYCILIKEFLKSLAQRFYFLPYNSYSPAKRESLCVEASPVLLFMRSYTTSTRVLVLRPALVSCPDAHNTWHRSIGRHKLPSPFFLHEGNRSTQSWISLTPGGP
jgi:hypothetical protein